MSAPTVDLLAQRIRDALFEMRCCRHHPDCRCLAYRPTGTAGWCTPRERTAQQSLDRLLDRIPH